MKICFLKDLKKGDKFRFNDKVYKVKRKFTQYKSEQPYLKTECNEIFYFDELEIEKVL